MTVWRVVLIAVVVAAGFAAGMPARSAQRATVWLRESTDGCGCTLVVESGAGSALAVDAAKVHVRVVDDRRHVVIGPDHFVLLQPARGEDGRTTIAFDGDATPATAGMYALTATFDAGALSAGGAALDVRSVPFRFYRGPSPKRIPALVVGQRFFDAAADRINGVEGPAIADPALVDATGTPLRRERIGLHPLTLTGLDATASPHVLTFEIEGVGAAVLRSDGDAWHLPGLVPLVDDAEVMRLERDYAGRHVWTVGGANFGCVSAGATTGSGGVPSDSEFIVEHVFRAARLPTFFAGIGNFGTTDRGSAFLTNDPIIVALHAAGSTTFGGASFSGPAASKPFDLRVDCVSFSARFADGWDFERAYTRRSLESAHPDWSAQTLEHIRSREVRVGMTHEMIAWMFGYAPVYGTATAVDRLDTWEYDDAAPFASTVYFHGDRVRAYDPPGWLP